MSENEQGWNSAVQIAFGDEIGPENFNDFWPSSTQSPGISPQPSPDSQLLEPASSCSEAPGVNQANLKNSTNQNLTHQAPIASCHQSSLISQSNLPQSKQLSLDQNALLSQSSPNTSCHQLEGQGGTPPKNVFHPTNTSLRPSSRPPPPFPNAQQKPQNKVPPNQNANTNPQYHQYNIGPPVRPMRPALVGQNNVRLQGPPNSQEPRHSVNAQPGCVLSSQAPSVNNQSSSQPKTSHNVHTGQNHQQQHHFQSQSPSVRQQPQAGRQNAQPGHGNHPNPAPAPRTMPHNQYMPNARPQTGPGQHNARMRPPGQPNPRMRMGLHHTPGQMIRPPRPTNATPQMAAPRHPGQFPDRFRPPPHGMRPNVPRQEGYPDFDYEEEDMYYDEFEDEDEDDEEFADLYGDMPYGDDYESDGSASNSSEEEHMLLTEYAECDDDERSEYLYEQLKARGVTPEQIETFKEDYVGQRTYDDMDYDDDDMDDDEDYDEEMVSSSTTLNNQMVGYNHPQQGHAHHNPSSPRFRPPLKQGPLQSQSAASSSSTLHHLPQGGQSGPRPQGAPMRASLQGYAMNPQRRPGPVHVTSSSTTPGSQVNQLPPHPAQPRQLSPAKLPGQTFQGNNNQKPGPMPPACSLSATESQNINLKQSSPHQQLSPTGTRASTPQSSAPQVSCNTVPVSSQSQPSTACHLATVPTQPQAVRQPLQQPGSGGSDPHPEGANYGAGQSGSPTLRPSHPRPPMPRQQLRFPQAQMMSGQTGRFHGHPRMPQSNMSSPRLRESLMGDRGKHNDAESARLAVLEMQQSLDKEIRAKKGIPTSNDSTSQSQQLPHQHHLQGAHNNHMGRPPRQRNPGIAGSSQFVRHQLPPRTPFPRTHGPRPLRGQTGRPVCSVPPFTSHPPQQAAPPTPRPQLQGNVGNLSLPRNAAPSQYSVNPSQPPVQNRMNSPVASQPATSASQTGGRSPSPKNPPPGGQVVNQSDIPFDQPKPVHAQGTCVSQGQSQLQTTSVPQIAQAQPPQQQQHLQQTPSKSESFNLGSLSEDKFIIKGTTPRLVANTVYQIKSPVDQTSKLARWNGERFEDLEPCGEKSVATLAGATSAKTPGDQQSQPQAFPSSMDSHSTSTVTSQGPDNQSQIRKDNKEDENPLSGQSTYVKPLMEDNPAANDENEDDEFVFKKPLNENEEHFRVCIYCGYTSKNFKRCEGCKRIFQGPVKMHVQKKKAPPPTSSSPAASSSKAIVLGPLPPKEDNAKEPDPIKEVMANVDFYGNKRGRGRSARGAAGRTRGGGMKGRMAGRKDQEEYDSSDSEDSVDKQNLEIPPGGPVKRKVGRGRAKGSAPRKKSKKIDEPVTVMISSDEDEPSSTSNTPQVTWPPPSPSTSAGSESPIFPGRHMDPPSTYGRFRRMLMEDEQGNSKISKKLQQQNFIARGLEDEEFDDEDDDEDGDEPPTYEIEIRSIRVGSMRTKPEGPLFLNMRGVCFRVRSERTEEAFECEIMSQEVEFVKYFGGQSPVLFFLITHECGEKLRDTFRMEEGGDEYLDPSSTDLKQKMVVIIFESSNYLPQDMRETLSLWADINHVEDNDFIEELTEESANDLLIQSAPAVLTADLEHDMVSFKKSYMKSEGNLSVMPRCRASPPNVADNEPDSTSSSPPQQTELHQYFDGPPIRLLQYPPPPARGIAITTEDLFCLHEGEFLNDVIIDFYLQYLYQEKLSEDLRERTHIFSSFFYKRLTQRDRQSEKTEEDAKKSIAERRHNRVRKWTKTVDLFSKDFIIVPINENSHWYLAVICFPGLASPEVVPFIPSTVHKAEADNESNEGEQPQVEGASTSEEKTPTPDPPAKGSKTILGKCMDPKLCLNSDEMKLSFGQKTPCILMFDSLTGPSRTPNVKMLRDYLQCEWNAKKSEARMISKLLRGTAPKVPQQSNFSDCGVYLLQYVESFFEDPIADFQIPMKGLQQWFTEKLIVTKRKEIHELIMRLHRQFQEERGDPKILDIKYVSGPPREELPPPPFPNSEQQHPYHHHNPHHPDHHMPHHQLPAPIDEHHWHGHPGYPADGMPGHDGEMEPGAFMDSGDSSNSGSMADSEEQNFLYPPSQETLKNEVQPAPLKHGNASSLPESGVVENPTEQNQNNSSEHSENSKNQNDVPSHPGDFLSQPSPSVQQQPSDCNEQSLNNIPSTDQKSMAVENSHLHLPADASCSSLSENADSQENGHGQGQW